LGKTGRYQEWEDRFIKKNKSRQQRKSAKSRKEQTSLKKSQSLTDFFAQSPLAKAKVNLERLPDYGRKIKI
jgi:hypothetical protein